MADFIFNIAKGKIAYYAGLPAASDGLIVIALKSSGIETDSTLKDYDDVASLLAGTSDEATNSGYARKTITSVTVTVDDTNDRVDLDFADQTWSAVQTTGGAWAKLVVAYDPDTGTGTDSTLVPLSAHDFAVTPDGSDITAQIAAAGFARAS